LLKWFQNSNAIVERTKIFEGFRRDELKALLMMPESTLAAFFDLIKIDRTKEIKRQKAKLKENPFTTVTNWGDFSSDKLKVESALFKKKKVRCCGGVQTKKKIEDKDYAKRGEFKEKGFC
jgi:hypothetical protein